MDEGVDQQQKTENSESDKTDKCSVTSKDELPSENESTTIDSKLVVTDFKYQMSDEKENKGRNPEEKLCGWLHHRARGIGNFKTMRLRWFQFGDENCKLYIYRDPEDFVPLGEVNIATASFDFDAGNPDKQGLFQIKSDGKEVLLDAGTRHNMMHWLQSLQTKRREFNLSRGSLSHDRVGQWSNKRISNLGGLISKGAGSKEAVSEWSKLGTSDIPQIHVPESDVHSSNSSLNSLPPSGSKSSIWALNNLKSEIKQKMANIKFPGKPTRDGQYSDSVFYCDLKLRTDSELLSVSTNSINSNDSLEHGNTSLLDVSDDNRKVRTGSQISQASTDSQDKDLEPVSTSRNRKTTSFSRNTGSWTVVDKQDFISEEELENGAENENNSGQSSGWKPYSPGTRVQNPGQGDSDTGKPGKFMTTLKKIRLGRRQISEPGPPPRPFSQIGSGVASSGNGDQVKDRSAANKDIQDLEDELNANREIIKLLQQKLDEITKEMEFRQQASGASNEEKMTLIVEKDRQIADLQLELEKYKQDYSATAEKLRSAEAELLSSRDQMEMYTDMLKAKDEAIISLSDQLQNSELKVHDPIPRTESFEQPDVIQSLSSRESTTSLQSEIKELERYKDICQGYELQHKFLTKEILELNDLRKDDLAREKNLMIDFAKMQAKYYQIKSKYYVLLKQQKEQAPLRDGEEGQEIVNQLLNDALETDMDDLELKLTGSAEEYDHYGFSRKHYTEETVDDLDVDPLGTKAVVLERQSEELNAKVKEADQVASLKVKWENYLVGRGGKLQKNQELKMLIRQGVPHEFREEVWKGCINFHVGELREKKGPKYYHELLQRKAQSQGSDPSIKQIELDLLRTLPNNKHYESIESEGIIKLRRVLLAFSEYDRVIGYCQGLNRLAAIALLFLNEEDAFWCLVAIVDNILPPEYFSTTLMAAQADQRVLKDLVQLKLPAVHQKLEANHVDLSLFTFNWFLTVFVDNVCTEMFLRIWDTFLNEGSKVLFRFAIAFLKKAEPEILQQEDGLHLNRYLRTIGEKMTNIRQISHYAFNWINPFPMRLLASKRQQHLHDIKMELSELDKIRRGLRMERKNQQQEYCSDDDVEG